MRSRGVHEVLDLDAAATVYTTIGNRWTTTPMIHPLDAIAGLVDDAAEAFTDVPASKGEFGTDRQVAMFGEHTGDVIEGCAHGRVVGVVALVDDGRVFDGVHF